MKLAPFAQRHSFLSISVTLLVWLPVVYGIDLGVLFEVKPGTDKGGTDGHKDIVQKWLDDTVTLVDFILPKLDADPAQVDGTDRHLVRNLLSWFNIHLRVSDGIRDDDREAYTTLRDKITAVDSFLKQQNSDWNTADNKPWLFYNSDWQEETELYFEGDGGKPVDTDGDIIMDPADLAKQAKVRSWKPPNFDQLLDSEKEFFDDMQKGSPGNWDKYAYWSSDIKDYELLDANERRKPGGFCVADPGEHFFALTITKMFRDSVTLCEDAFTENAEFHETIDDGLNSDAATNDKANVPLQDTSPRSLTLFHELIHLTSGPDETPDKGTKPGLCLQLIKDKKFDEARNNPDSIVYFAWSYYLSMTGNDKYRWNTGKKIKS